VPGSVSLSEDGNCAEIRACRRKINNKIYIIYIYIYIYIYRIVHLLVRGRDSSVGIATGYGLDGPGFESK